MTQKRHQWTKVLFALIAAATTCAAAGKAIADDAVLEIEGTCPGQVRISWSGALPNRPMGIVCGNEIGSAVIPGGRCLGTVIGIRGSLQAVVFLNTRTNGAGSATGRASKNACGRYLQLVVSTLDHPCQISNPARLP